jgi:effector-binding domain-containing protein
VPLKGPCFTLYHSQEPDVDTEVCEPLGSPVTVGDPVQVYELPGEELVASVVHHGPFTTIGEAYGAVMMWIQNNGYHICGPEREIYLKEAAPVGNQNDPNTVTEIQFPVEKD